MRRFRSHLPTITLLAATVATLVAIGILVYIAVPRTQRQCRQPSFQETPPAPSAVNLMLTLESIHSTTGTIHVGLDANPGARLPPGGAVVLTSLGSIPALPVPPSGVTREQEATLLFQSGDVSNYPFEDYGITFHLVAFDGTDPAIPAAGRPRVVLDIVGVSNLANFNTTAQERIEKDGTTTIILQVRRTVGTRGWVLAMMGIYWVVALGAAAMTVLVVTRKRQWETGMLAWLGALIFAFFAFRAVAPGDPPVGTFFDFFAVFEAIGIVAVALIVLIVHYLVQSPERLNLPPPP